jgi:DNA-binding transcriptional regulator YbjK
MELSKSWRKAAKPAVCISTMRRSPSQIAPLSGSKRSRRRRSLSEGYLKFKIASNSKASLANILDINQQGAGDGSGLFSHN